MRNLFIFFSAAALLFSFSHAAVFGQSTLGQSTLTNIDFTTIRALKDIAKAVQEKQLSAVTVTHVYQKPGQQLSSQEIDYFTQKMSSGFGKISLNTASGERSGSAIRFSENAFAKIDANLSELIENEAALKKIQTPYFSHLIIRKGQDSFSLTMVVFKTSSKEQVWSKSWQNFGPTRKQSSDDEEPPKKYSKLVRTISDIGAVLFIDDYYFFGLYAFIGGEIADTATIGLNLGSLVSVGTTLNTNVNVGGVDYNVDASIFGLTIPLSLMVGFSLINSHQRDFDIFDLEFQIEAGVLWGTLTATGTVTSSTGLSVPFDVRTIAWRPIISLGLNFLFIEQIYLRAGVDLSPIVTSAGSFERPETQVIPYVGLGYRFDM